jgi:hypothetical protein
MNAIQSKEAIRCHNVDHRQVMMLGGISPSSQLYIDFTQRQQEILGAFALEPTSQNKRLLFKYPFSGFINIKRLPNEELTNKMCIKLMWNWAFNGSKEIGFREGTVKFGTTRDKAGFILKNLGIKAIQKLNS